MTMIQYIYGPMGAEKSGALLDIAERQISSLSCIAFTDASDSVNGATIRSRKGNRSIPARPVTDSFDLLIQVHDAIKSGTFMPGGFVLVDEVHRICRQSSHQEARAFLAACLALAHRGFLVSIAGLNTGHHGHLLEPFDTIMHDARIRRSVQLVRGAGGFCHFCGPACPSTHSWMVEDREHPIAGRIGFEYLGVCSACFWDLMRQRVEARARSTEEVRLAG